MANWWEEMFGKEETAYDNTVLSEEGFEQLGKGEWEEELTGERTTESLLDAILPGLGGIGVAGRLGKVGWEKGLKEVYKRIFGPKLGKELAIVMKGKIKGDKLIAAQPFRHGMIGKSVDKPVTSKEYQKGLELYAKMAKAQSYNLGKDIKGGVAQIAKKESSGGGKAGILGLLGLLGILGQDDSEDTSSERDMPHGVLMNMMSESRVKDLPSSYKTMPLIEALIGETVESPRYSDPNYYEGETVVGEDDLMDIVKKRIINKPKHYSVPGF